MDNENTVSRRSFLRNSLRMAVIGAGSVVVASGTVQAETGEVFEVVKTDKEWKAQLGNASYQVLRHEDTERPGTSPLLSEKREGIFHCAGCDLAVYDSKTKYESGTGWPSFYESLPNAVGTREDRRLIFSVRTEVHCRRCGGHFGHIFDDGPKPTGMRHCLNGLALTFKPKSA
ncbi:peptide-methionine (R)-S-oxide reductase MsrB [Leucothrix arctica]|uniref:peptide-methionine (R)-S-oxide reductase n=1 Tax=Leucothrix arctica TaxID=1481894 RepID=A0A317CJD7_9GAMM|nr:peptide-methionine (R)-S-oxide reductase MsrB [Leucothrix arctica]PWQ98301.1 peptide-methionine (R)-S-oxide reductase [Leucothrix arctica]